MHHDSGRSAQTQAARQDLVALLPRLRRYAYALTGSIEEGDDLVQSACARVLEKADQRGAAPFDRWVMRVTRNLWIDGHRARSRRAEVPMAAAADHAGYDGERALAAATTLEQTRVVIAQLPVQQREVLALVAVEGYSYRDAAQLLDVPVGTVMSRLARARAAVVDGMTRPRQPDKVH